jgi:hypothetical protein
MARGAVALRLAALLLATAAPARAGWVVDARGRCVQATIAPPPAQGPAAMLNAFALPLRQAVGGGQIAAETDTPAKNAVLTALTWPALIAGGFGVGLIEAPIWLLTGLADTLSLGALDLVPNDARALTLASIRPRFLEPSNTTPASCAAAGQPAP